MDKKRYQREMDRISMSPAFRAALTEAMAGEKPARRPRRAWRTALLAAALCGALAVSALALSPTLRQALEDALGGYAQYARPVDGAAVSNGAELRVVSALNGGSILKVYAEVRGLEEQKLGDLQPICGILAPTGEGAETGGGSTSGGEWVGYDPESGTALVEFSAWGLPIRSGDRLRLTAVIPAPPGQLSLLYEWHIEFAVEELPVRSIPLSGTIGDTPLLRAEISALGVTLYSGGRETIAGYPLAVCCEDGSVLTPVYEGGGSTGDTRLTCWEYDEPVEPETITGLALGQWYIPLEGDTALPGRWLAALPAAGKNAG